jgi:voltage-gated potassium channel
VFLLAVFSIVIIIGSLIYVIEGPDNGFNNIPLSIYWAIVTLTTVGYGDISPQTPLGQFFASIVMIIGFAIIAVPTGIVTVELAEAGRKSKSREMGCPGCANNDNDPDARFCKRCGMELVKLSHQVNNR